MNISNLTTYINYAGYILVAVIALEFVYHIIMRRHLASDAVLVAIFAGLGIYASQVPKEHLELLLTCMLIGIQVAALYLFCFYIIQTIKNPPQQDT